MDPKKEINRKLIWLWSAIGFLLPFLGFLFLKNSRWGGEMYYNLPVHSVLLFIVCATASFAAYVAYKGYKESKEVNLFLTSIAFYTFSFVFFLHGAAAPIPGLFSEELFDITEHYGLFLGSLILFGLILPLEGLRGFLHRNSNKIFGGWVFFLLAVFVAFIFFPSLTEKLAESADFFIILTIPFTAIILFFLIFSYQRSRSSLFFYFIVALAILINSGIIPLFYKEWNFLWWYFHFTFLAPFLIILFGLLRHRHEKEEIVRALGQMSSKLLIIFLLIGLLPLGFFGYFHIENSRQDLEKEIKNKLLLFAETKEGQVFVYLDALESRTLDFSSDGLINDLAEKINKTGSEQAVEDLNYYLINNKQALDPAIVGIIIIDLKGIIIAATDDDELGDDESDDEYFIEGKKGVFTIEVEEGGGHFNLENPIAVAAPMTNHQGELLGVLVNIFKTKKLYDILSGEFQIAKGALSIKEGWPQTMEIYLVDRQKRMLGQLYQEKNKEQFAAMVVDTLPVQKCLDDHKEISEVYTNYKSEQVVGASTCIIQRDWTLVSEMSAKEAFLPIKKMQQRLVLSLLLFAVLVAGLALVFSRTITNPLRKLHHGSERIGAGDFEYRLDIETGDEIEQLANEFNLMAEKLAASYRGLEVKIKELSGEQSKMLSLIESVKLGVIMVDLSLNVILVNPAAKTIFGKSPEESLAFKEVEERLKEVNISQALSYYVEEGKPVNIKEVKFGEKYFRLFMSAVRDIKEKHFIGAVMVIEDITEQKFIDRMRTEIASITSHQLRTPLSVIKGNLEMILGGDFGKISKQQKEVLDEVFLGNERMVHLVNSLMDVAKIDEGKFDLDLRPVKLEELISETVKELLPFAQKSGVALSYQPSVEVLPEISVDSQKIKQALQNIIENGVKYSKLDHSGKVVVAVRKDKSGKFLEVVIKDNGAGIPKAEQGKIFQRFFRGSNTTQMDPGGGTGIGLFIDKAAIERHGGKIWFESEGEGKGTTFYFTLPLQK